jgi:hypothetical protein
MDHQHNPGASPCEICKTRPHDDFGLGSRAQSFRGQLPAKLDAAKAARG